MMSLTPGQLIWGSTVSPQEEAMKYFREKQELKCDPLYLAVIVGNVHNLSLKLKKEREEEKAKLTQSGKTVLPLKGIKISFKEDSSVKTEEPGLSQTLVRAWNGERREELSLIRPHLVKLLRWFDYEDPMIKTILKVFKSGLEDILAGYREQPDQEISITQVPSNQKEENNKDSSPALTVKIQEQTPETDVIIRILENDIDLLNHAIKEKKDERQIAELKEKLASEEKKYFHFHQLRLIKAADQTIDAYLAEKVKETWDLKTLQGIVSFFEARPNEAFNHFDSIASLVSKNPATYHELKLRIRDLIASTLPNCTVKIQKVSK
jgi:hypothetical protein